MSIVNDHDSSIPCRSMDYKQTKMMGTMWNIPGYLIETRLIFSTTSSSKVCTLVVSSDDIWRTLRIKRANGKFSPSTPHNMLRLERLHGHVVKLTDVPFRPHRESDGRSTRNSTVGFLSLRGMRILIQHYREKMAHKSLLDTDDMLSLLDELHKTEKFYKMQLLPRPIITPKTKSKKVEPDRDLDDSIEFVIPPSPDSHISGPTRYSDLIDKDSMCAHGRMVLDEKEGSCLSPSANVGDISNSGLQSSHVGFVYDTQIGLVADLISEPVLSPLRGSCISMVISDDDSFAPATPQSPSPPAPYPDPYPPIPPIVWFPQKKLSKFVPSRVASRLPLRNFGNNQPDVNEWSESMINLLKKGKVAQINGVGNKCGQSVVKTTQQKRSHNRRLFVDPATVATGSHLAFQQMNQLFNTTSLGEVLRVCDRPLVLSCFIPKQLPLQFAPCVKSKSLNLALHNFDPVAIILDQLGVVSLLSNVPKWTDSIIREELVVIITKLCTSVRGDFPYEATCSLSCWNQITAQLKSAWRKIFYYGSKQNVLGCHPTFGMIYPPSPGFERDDIMEIGDKKYRVEHKQKDYYILRVVSSAQYVNDSRKTVTDKRFASCRVKFVNSLSSTSDSTVCKRRKLQHCISSPSFFSLSSPSVSSNSPSFTCDAPMEFDIAADVTADTTQQICDPNIYLSSNTTDTSVKTKKRKAPPNEENHPDASQETEMVKEIDVKTYLISNTVILDVLEPPIHLLLRILRTCMCNSLSLADASELTHYIEDIRTGVKTDQFCHDLMDILYGIGEITLPVLEAPKLPSPSTIVPLSPSVSSSSSYVRGTDRPLPVAVSANRFYRAAKAKII